MIKNYIKVDGGGITSSIKKPLEEKIYEQVTIEYKGVGYESMESK